ncbi:hypothetical protein OHA37_38040 [Streptomyces sp. NBC_00335]|uniref:hypothetical protein n=1 Tax=unclassified Streptomyces TaxID=2593676 RepID=UPI0022597F3D|nr:MULTISPECIES: hypothetical protein [unclassified Streptomyces]MCX5409647.1 hypothetical protein [Streptomyces sp. NBC_00086]
MRRHANHQLKTLMDEAGYSAAELARQVRALAHPAGLDVAYGRSTVSHWLAGSRPPAPVPELVAQALSERLGRCVSAEDTGLTRHPAHLGAAVRALSPGASPLATLILLAREDLTVEGRAELTRSVFRPGPVPQPPWHDRVPPPRARPGRQPVAGPALASAQMTKVFHTMYDAFGGRHGRGAVASYIADDMAALLTRIAPGADRRQGLRTATELAHLMARMSDDAGHHALAQHYFTAALALAAEADERTTYAITLRVMSAQAVRIGRHRYAAALADAAVKTTRGRAAHAEESFLLTQQALTLALDARPRAAVRVLVAAEALHDDGQVGGNGRTGRNGLGGTYPRAAFDYQRAQVLRAVGEHRQAAIALTASLRHRPPDERRNTALTHADLAETLTGIGHLDEAGAHWTAFLAALPHLHSATVDQAHTRIRQHLAAHQRHPGARLLLDRSNALVLSRPQPRTAG